MRRIRAGDMVEVRSRDEILSTLDEGGCLDGLPFMDSEMSRFCGRGLRVAVSLNRIHISGAGVRGIRDTLILEGARCRGEGYGGCGRACTLMFKSQWLRVIDEPDGQVCRYGQNTGIPATICQGRRDALLNATYPLSPWNPSQYAQDLTGGTWRLRDIASMVLFLLNTKWDARQPIWEVSASGPSITNLTRMARLVISRGKKKQHANSSGGPTVVTPIQDLRPGDLVRVRSKEEILATLDHGEKNRGLKFYGCMLKHCGQLYRVLRRVDCVVDEISGKLVRGITGTVLLDGALCDGISYRGCPRACHWLWREAWLERVE